MPTSLIVVALVVAWLVVLVPMIVRKRQEIAKTADSELAARVVRSASAHDAGEPCGPAWEEFAMADGHDDVDEVHLDDVDDVGDIHDDDDTRHNPDPHEDHGYDPGVPDYESQRRYRPGRGGFDPLAAALAAKAKYTFRQRVVVTMILGAVVSAVVAAVAVPTVWWVHGGFDLALVGYLAYLRRQVRIEEEIRQRRLARMSTVRRVPAAHPRPAVDTAPAEVPHVEPEPEPAPQREHGIVNAQPAKTGHHGAVVVDLDDEDPAFDELDEPGVLPYRRAVGE